MVLWVGYVARPATPGVRFADNGTVWLDNDNELQPDVMLYGAK